MFNNTIEKARKLYNEYPRLFWVLVGITFVDRLGGALIFPFFALYITAKFNVGMTDVGILFAVFSVSSFAGNAIGGALADRFGRKGIILFGLVASALSTITMAYIEDFQKFFILALCIGLLADIAGPARQAMIADILPEDKRTDGFGILHVAFNLSVVLGPAIGGLLAAYSYFMLFMSDAVISVVTALLIFSLLPETRPQAHKDSPQESLGGTFAGYGRVFQNAAYMLFLGASMLGLLAYMNMNTSLGVYLRNVHGTPESGYGFLLSINAIMVVFLQFPFARRVRKYPPMLMMALGTFLYAVGFSMYGYVSTYVFFVTAMVIITIGEMMITPISQSLIASFAPEDMRGRYMAVAGIIGGFTGMTGPYLAGLLLDGPNPKMLWYAAGFVGMLSVAGFLSLHRKHSAKYNIQPTPEAAAS